jgi:hypothetical protein
MAILFAFSQFVLFCTVASMDGRLEKLETPEVQSAEYSAAGTDYRVVNVTRSTWHTLITFELADSKGTARFRAPWFQASGKCPNVSVGQIIKLEYTAGRLMNSDDICK